MKRATRVAVLKKKIIVRLKRLTTFLDNKWNKKTPKNLSPIASLAPKVITDREELKGILPYLHNLKQALDTENVNNIAVTGNYGSGKSTILRTFECWYRYRYRFLNISLASFEGKKINEDMDYYDKTVLEQELEISILQQIFYHVEPSEIPNSRFKRIANLKTGEVILLSSMFILWIVSAIILFKFNLIGKLNPEELSFKLSVDWIALLSLFIFFGVIAYNVKNLYYFFKNSKINKISITGELELGDSDNSSIFNQNLEEILYFFEKTNFNVVVIEDLDRFGSTDIFTKLREVNVLINNSKSIKRPIKFVYAIKDDLFKDKNERIKFFDFIIPIIPFINPSNAKDQLAKLIKNASLKGILSPNFTSDIITFIDDIDMRLLINIFQEYQLHRSILSKDLDQDRLFAVIIYKNLYPDDFGKLQRREGNLYIFFANKHKYSDSLLTKLNLDSEKIKDKIGLIENEVDKPIKELRAPYIIQIISKLHRFHSFNIEEKEIKIDEALEDEFFDQIKKAPKILYYRHGASESSHRQSVNSKSSFNQIEEVLSYELKYEEREKLLIDKTNNKINSLKLDREKIENRLNEIKLMTVVELFGVIDPEKHLGSFIENNLMRYLLLSGYINENYEDYITIFHEVNITRDDYKFIRHVKSGRKLPYEFSLIKIDNLIKDLHEIHFRKEGILNYNLFTYLLENKSTHTLQLNWFFNVLTTDGEKQFEFIQGYIKHKPEDIAVFMAKLCEIKPSLWQYLNEKSSLPDEGIRKFLKFIFEYGDLDDLLKLESIDSLGLYLSEIKDFFKFLSTFDNTNTIESFIVQKRILFKSLDLPNPNQDEVFDLIYYNNLYILNQHNISFIIQGANIEIDETELATANYSTVSKTGLHDLKNYINDNIENYIKNVLLLNKNNTKEDEKSLIKILNTESEHLSLEIKYKMSEHQEIVISKLDSIETLDSKQVVLETNKLNPTWNNIFDYYDSIEEGTFDDILINYLNHNNSYSILSESEIRSNGKDEDYIKIFSRLLILCNDLSIVAYEKLLSSLTYIYYTMDFESLNLEKVKALVKCNILALTNSNFINLKEVSKSKDLHIHLIAQHQNDLINKLETLSIEKEDYYLILKSKNISLNIKKSLVEIINDSILEDNKIARLILDLLLVKDQSNLNYNKIKAILKSDSPLINKKVKLLNLKLKDYDDEQVKSLIHKLGKSYSRLFKSLNKPWFQNDKEHYFLINALKDKGLISSFSIDEKNNRITANAFSSSE